MIRKTIGAALVSVPFVMIGAVAWAADGFGAVLLLFGAAGAIMGCIMGGLHLLEDY